MGDVEIRGVQPHNGITMMRAGLVDVQFEYCGYEIVTSSDADHGYVYQVLDRYRDPTHVVASWPVGEFDWETNAAAREELDARLDEYEASNGGIEE